MNYIDSVGCQAAWRFTESGERVRVSLRTGQAIPLPPGYEITEDRVKPSSYKRVHSALYSIITYHARPTHLSTPPPALYHHIWLCYLLFLVWRVFPLLYNIKSKSTSLPFSNTFQPLFLSV